MALSHRGQSRACQGGCPGCRQLEQELRAYQHSIRSVQSRLAEEIDAAQYEGVAGGQKKQAGPSIYHRRSTDGQGRRIPAHRPPADQRPDADRDSSSGSGQLVASKGAQQQDGAAAPRHRCFTSGPRCCEDDPEPCPHCNELHAKISGLQRRHEQQVHDLEQQLRTLQASAGPF